MMIKSLSNEHIDILNTNNSIIAHIFIFTYYISLHLLNCITNFLQLTVTYSTLQFSKIKII